MSAKGKERTREIREPFGSGIDKKREAEAIRQNPPRPDMDAFPSIYRNARDPAGTSRHEPTISVYGCVEVRSSAGKYRFPQYRCPGVQVGCEKSQTKFSDRSLLYCDDASRNSFRGICYRPCAPIESGARPQNKNEAKEMAERPVLVGLVPQVVVIDESDQVSWISDAGNLRVEFDVNR